MTIATTTKAFVLAMAMAAASATATMAEEFEFKLHHFLSPKAPAHGARGWLTCP